MAPLFLARILKLNLTSRTLLVTLIVMSELCEHHGMRVQRGQAKLVFAQKFFALDLYFYVLLLSINWQKIVTNIGALLVSSEYLEDLVFSATMPKAKNQSCKFSFIDLRGHFRTVGSVRKPIE